MPNDYKVNLFFAAPARFPGQVPAGWSETYYTQDVSLDAALTSASNLAASRALILAVPCTIIGFRASELGGMRISELGNPQGYTQFAAAYTSDTPWQAQLMSLNDGAGTHRSLMIRGIPDVVYNPDAGADTAAQMAWQAAAQAYLTGVLVAGPWFMYAISKDFVTYPQVPVLSMLQLAPGIISVVTSAAHGLSPAEIVHLYNSGIRPPLGNVRVQSIVTATSFTVNGTLQAGWALPVTAYIRRIVKVLVGIQGGGLERITHRITGRPFGEQRGRRRQGAT